MVAIDAKGVIRLPSVLVSSILLFDIFQLYLNNGCYKEMLRNININEQQIERHDHSRKNYFQITRKVLHFLLQALLQKHIKEKR